MTALDKKGDTETTAELSVINRRGVKGVRLRIKFASTNMNESKAEQKWCR